MESYLHMSNSIVLIIVYIMDSVYVQKLVFPVLLLLVPSMEYHKINFDVVVTTNKLSYGLSITTLPVWHCHYSYHALFLVAHVTLLCTVKLIYYYHYHYQLFLLFLKGSEPKGLFVHLVSAFLEM